MRNTTTSTARWEALAVGNYDSPLDHGQYSLPLGPGHAFIYDIATSTFLTDVVYPGSKSDTAYGIWYNGGTSYTICGGYSLNPVNNFTNQNQPIGQAFLVDYDSATGKFSHWASFSYPFGNNFVTHFEGISSTENGVYTLNADSLQAGSQQSGSGFLGDSAAQRGRLVRPGDVGQSQLSERRFGQHQQLQFRLRQSGGRCRDWTEYLPFQATVNIAFQFSNVISGNGGNGIELNQRQQQPVIAMNYIGTNAAGTLARANGGNGIWITNGSSGNLIGGEATGGNDPTNSVFVRPPQGNLISGNDGNGVLIDSGSTNNQLSGNFIGTDDSGDVALGNHLDGVAIQNANGNSLIGCTFQQDPFVFYNVISGNGGNGLRVTNSNNTTIQANFFGMGADNDTAVGNQLNGVVVEGTSSNTVMGGPIPLGNVDACNLQNGLVVRGSASNFVTYNTFCGLAAFSQDLNFGNDQDGMLITATGGNILIRTCVITCNGSNGIEIGGSATGVRVAGNIIGLDTNGNAAMGNIGNGITVDGNAHNIVIGGPQPTFNIIPHNVISANGGNGVAISGHAHNITVSYSYIGTDLIGTTALGNAGAGVYLAPGTYTTTIGSPDPSLLTVISGNGGDGITMNGTHGNTVIGSVIGTDSLGVAALPNLGNGISITNSSNNTIGSPTAHAGMPANIIAFNEANGVLVQSGNQNAIRANAIYCNALLGIDLAAGANHNQPAPALTSVVRLPLSIEIAGTLTSTPNATFTIEFFANATSSTSGRLYLGSLNVKTNGSGVGMFVFFGPLPPATASVITATATDAGGDTSEFSVAPT